MILLDVFGLQDTVDDTLQHCLTGCPGRIRSTRKRWTRRRERKRWVKPDRQLDLTGRNIHLLRWVQAACGLEELQGLSYR